MLGVFLFVGVPSQSRLAPCQRLGCPFGGGGLALARTERASCQRPPRMGCVEALAGCPLSRLTATAPPKGEPSLASPFGGRWCPVGTVQRLVSAAASVGDGRSPLGCITRAGRREWTRVSEDGGGKVPAAPSHGLCGSAGGLPSQSPNGDSSPEGGAKSRLPLWGAQKSFAPPPDAKKDTRRHRMSCFYRARGGLRPPRSPS